MAKPVELTDATFAEEVLNTPVPVIVDFWATWCGPCQMVSPIVEGLAERYEGQVKVCKMDVDVEPKTAIEYGIRGIPTVLFFKNGKVVNQIVGAYPKGVYVEKIESLLA